MRVVFVSPFTTHHGVRPARIRTRRTARLLADRGHDVTVLCAQWWDGDHGTFEDDGVVYRSVCRDPAPGRFARRLPAALLRTEVDVVQTVNSPASAALTAELTGRLRRTPVVVDWWSDRRADGRFALDAVARAADAVLVPTRTIGTAVREHGARDDVVHVLPESIDMSLIRNASVDDRFDVVYSRRLDRHANVETFLLGLAELRDRDWTAAIIGDGPERAAVEAVAADLGVDERVQFLGDLPVEDRIPLFRGAHVVVQTARHEVFPTDLLWALACGCFGLVEYQAGSSAHELVEGRTRASLVTDPGELADAFVAAGNREHRTVDETFAEFDHGAVLEGYLACFRDLLGES